MQNRRTSYEFEDLLACGRGEMFAEGPQLPLPPMLMFDRITELSEEGGEYGKGLVRAELIVKPDLWFSPAISKAIRSCRAASASTRSGNCWGFSSAGSGRRARAARSVSAN